MADLSASIAKAKRAGYSDEEITAYLAKDPGLSGKVQQAKAAGYSARDIVGHLGKVNVVKDVAKATLGGLSEGAAGVADLVMSGPMGAPLNALQTAAGVASGLRGRGKPEIANPFSAFGTQAAKTSYKPQTSAGGYGRAIGMNAPNAVLAPGSVAARAANVFAPALVSEASAQTARGMGAGETGQAIARGVGGVVGGGLASVRVRNPFANAPDNAPNTFARRSGADPAKMRAEAERLRAAGVEPTLTDVSGERGRRFIRAVGVKDDVAGEVLQENARKVSSSTKPAVMARTRDIGPMRGKTADELVEMLDTARGEAARTNYGPAYATKIDLTPQIKSALGGKDGQAAIARAIRAAEARRDVEALDDLRSLQRYIREGRSATPKPFSLTSMSEETRPTVSAAALDRVQIALGKTARNLQKNDAGDIAAGLTGRQSQINATLDQVPELGPARADYRAKSTALNVLGEGRKGFRKDVFSTDPADYGRWLESLPPEARAANQVAIRQEIMDTLGGQRSSTFGTLDELATSQYARANLKQALGPEADQYLANIEGRLSQFRNAQFVSPNAGSRTAVLENDITGLMGAVQTGADVARGNVMGLVTRAAQWLSTRGIPEQEAQAIAKAATDPRALDQVIMALEERLGPQEAQSFIAALRQAGLIGAASVTAGFREQPSGQPGPQAPR